MIIQKTLIIPTQQDKRIEELYNVYSQAFRLAYAGYSYKQLRTIFPSYNSQMNAKQMNKMRVTRMVSLA
jgi:hypothetical protein